MNGRGVMARTRNASKALAHCVPKLVYNCLANKAETNILVTPQQKDLRTEGLTKDGCHGGSFDRVGSECGSCPWGITLD